MGTPRRHGQRWSTVPTPLSDGAPGIAVRGDLTPIGSPKPRPQVVPVRELDAFLSALPRESLSFLLKSQEVRYDHSKKVGETITVGQLSVPQNYVWVLIDTEFYAYGPATGMGAAPTTINAGGLVGILKLAVRFGGSDPVNSLSYRMSPYTSPSQTAASTSGWPWLERSFGVNRMPSFALYAKENQVVSMKLTVESVPRFPITKVGANIHGFALPSAEFARIWVK